MASRDASVHDPPVILAGRVLFRCSWVLLADERREAKVKAGGCCIAMYGGAGGEADAAWKFGRIMLRFRPIAPRPVAGAPAGSVVTQEAYAPVKRPKRKGSAKGSGGSGRRGKAKKVEATVASLSTSLKEDDKSSLTSSFTFVTLPLIPETPERKDSPVESRQLKWCRNAEGAGVVASPRPGRKVMSWVTVECVTDAWQEGGVVWRSDEGVKAALAADDCPGFVSDVWERVTWANEAYKRMVGASCSEVEGGIKGDQEEDAVTVELMTRGLVPSAWACRAFTCRVRVSYTVQPGRGNKSSPTLAAPCDAWRMDSGCCAWRLDVMAALSLSV